MRVPAEPRDAGQLNMQQLLTIVQQLFGMARVTLTDLVTMTATAQTPAHLRVLGYNAAPNLFILPT